MKYTKSDHSSLDGERYEIRLAAHLFLRCKRSPTISRFQLATNAKAGMKLDDVVLRYKTVADPDVWLTWFLQLKKKTGRTLTDSTLTGDSADFGFKRYVESFVRIKEGMSADDKEEILNGPWENCCFGLYTNVEAEGKLLGRTESGPMGELETLLESEAKTPIVLGFEEGRDAIIFKALEGDVHGKEFLKTMKVFPGQPTPAELEFVIKRELKLRGDVSDENIHFLYDSYEKRVEKWWAEPKESEFLDENSDIYDLAVADARSHHVSVSSSRESALACHDIVFADLKPLEDNFDDATALLHVIASEPSLGLSCTKLLQYMRRHCPGSVTFFRLELLTQEQDTVLPVWRSDGNVHRLVVHSNSDEGDEDHRELGDKIYDILLENKNKRLAVVSRKCDSFTSYLKKKLCNDYKEFKDNCRVLQLDEEALGKLMKLSVAFQGFSVDIKSFFEENDCPPQDITLDDGVLKSLNSKNTPTIGRAMPDDASWYISRTLQSFAVLRDDVLRADLRGTVAVSGVTHRELQDLIPAGESVGLVGEARGGCRFVSLDPARAEGEWRELREAVHTAHWIHRGEDGKLALKESTGSVGELRPHVDPTSRLCYMVDDCFDVPQRAVLVVGEPGMGKTTLASHLAKRTKRARPARWVVYVNMAEHARLLERGDGPVEFLSEVLGIARSPFQTSLLRRAVEATGNVTVLLDGFDEVCPANESQGLRLMAGLLRTRVEKVWVTSRRSVGYAVEREMSTLATRLQDFTVENQTAFLLRYWKDEAGCKDRSDDELKELIARLLARLSKSLNDQERRFTGIPLQTMMLAEVFTKYATNPSEFQLPKKLDLIYLFEQFVEKKFIVYVKKLWPDTFSNVNSTVREDMRTSFIENHMYASLVYLLSQDWLKKLDSKDKIIGKTNEFMVRVLSGEDKKGIVDGVVNERPNFIHRCFAEFFVAKFFLKSYKRNRDFLREYMFSVELSVVRAMFDGMLVGRRPLHSAVLGNNMDLAGRLLAEGWDVNDTDEGGRTALHLVAGVNPAVENAALDEYKFNLERRLERLSRRFTQKLDLDDICLDTPPPARQNMYVPRVRKEADEWGRQQPGVHPTTKLVVDGADVNMVDLILGWTPFQYAVGAGNWVLAETLLARGSDPSRFFFPADSSELWSSIVNKDYVNLMKCVVDQGMYVDDHPDYCYGVLKSNDRLKLLKSFGKTNKDPQLLQARYGQKDILHYFIDVMKSGGYTKAVIFLDHFGNNPMSLANGTGFRNILGPKSKYGRGPKFLEKNRNAFVRVALRKGHLDVVEFLIGSLRNDRASLKSYLESLYKNGGITNAVLGDYHVLRYLVEKGCDVSAAVDESGTNALHAVIGLARLSDVRPMVECLGDDRAAVRALVNAPYRGGVTPLHCLSYLNVNPREKRGAFTEHAKIAQYLLRNGADVWATDENGQTPLHWAAGRFACLPVAEVLVASLGEDSKAILSYVSARDSWGRTAKDLMQDCQYYALSGRQDRLEVAKWLDRVSEENAAAGGS